MDIANKLMRKTRRHKRKQNWLFGFVFVLAVTLLSWLFI
jgi:hypothetical protein